MDNSLGAAPRVADAADETDREGASAAPELPKGLEAAIAKSIERILAEKLGRLGIDSSPDQSSWRAPAGSRQNDPHRARQQADRAPGHGPARAPAGQPGPQHSAALPRSAEQDRRAERSAAADQRAALGAAPRAPESSYPRQDPPARGAAGPAHESGDDRDWARSDPSPRGRQPAAHVQARAQAHAAQAHAAQAHAAQAHAAQAHAHAHAHARMEPAGAEGEEESPFDERTVYDRAFGAFLGFALGDAVGLQAEGDDPETIAERHPKGLGFPYRGAFRGYQPNDWTDATDNAVVAMRTLAAYFTSKTETPEAEFAAQLVRWSKSGFPELGDTSGLTPESVVARALAAPGFARDPAGAARALKGPKADNGALTRALACAFTDAPAEWAALLGETTHADSRCTASAVVFASLVRDLACRPAGEPPRAAALIRPARRGRARIEEPVRQADLADRLTRSGSAAEIGLAGEHRSFTLKTLACAAWALRRASHAAPDELSAGGAEFFRRAILELAGQGGDASANCAVAGAVLGVVLGNSGLPKDWLTALPHRAWLDKEIASFLQAASKTWAQA